MLSDFNYEYFLSELELGGVLKYKENDVSVSVLAENGEAIVTKYMINDSKDIESGKDFMEVISKEKIHLDDVKLRELYDNVLSKKYIFKRAKYNS